MAVGQKDATVTYAWPTVVVPILESLSLWHPLYRVLYCTTAIALMKVEVM